MSATRPRLSGDVMSATALPPDASARLAMLAEMLERSSSKPEGDKCSDGNRQETSRVESSPRKTK
jgi:hypothetical protein